MRAAEPVDRRARLRWGIALGAVLALALGLRVWGVKHGLPYAYNADENAHFVTRSIGLFGHDWDPRYYVNPPAYTYLAHILLSLWFGGREGVTSSFAADPTEIWILTRVLAAVLGTLAVWLAYLAAARLLDRRVALLGAAIYSVSFLPVFYSKLALNDVPTLTGVGLALWGAAGVLRFGRMRDYVIAGLGLGLASATKYTGGIVLIPLVVAAAAQLGPSGRLVALRGLGIALVVAAATFLAANPYAILDHEAFWEGLQRQSQAAGDTSGKLGLEQDNGYLYYLWSFGWGLGWVPLVLAAGGAVWLWFRERRLFWVLATPVVVFVVFMGSQERYFGRWLMPVFPFVCILAAYAALQLAALGGRFMPALRSTFVALAVIAVCEQGLVYSIHSGLVMSRDDTRNLARDWMVANVPLGDRIVLEPIVPGLWTQDIGNPSPFTRNGNRWAKFFVGKSLIDPTTGRAGVFVHVEDYERALRPALVDSYERDGYCHVVVGSTQRGRAEAEPEQVPRAIAYYEELARRADVVHEVSPYAEGEGPVKFNFDWTFDYYPRAFERPGPDITIYRLRGGKCSTAIRR